MIKSKPIMSFLLLMGFFIFSSCQQHQKVTVLKLGHSLAPTNSVHKAMVYMGKRLEKLSGGTMKLEIYPSSQLGGESQCLELLQIGSLAMTKVSAAALEGFAPEFQVLSLPYIFKDKAHAFKVLDGPIGQGMLKQAQKFWLRGLCYYDAGSRSFYTKDTPINSPDDLNGLKIRVMKSKTAVEMVKLLGGSPTPISFGELYTALQGGVVDGAENNPPSFYLSHHYEVCKYYSLDEHTMVPDVLLISTIVWNKLTPQQQKWLQEAANESVPVQRKLWAESEKESLAAVKKAGVKIIHPDKEPFRDKVKGMYEQYKNDSTLYSLIKRIQAVDTLKLSGDKGGE
ncbi:TRAP transporter substrate-binding protein [Prolixibacter denitrificans]|nr:TRAP transporter substrate-binding protein [Prolixibacter denitrificans]